MKNDRWNYPEEVKEMKFTKHSQRHVLNQLDSQTAPKRSKRWITPILTGVAVIFLMIASVLYVPALEPVLAKIPFISQYVQDEEDRMEEANTVLQTVNTILKDQGHELHNYVYNKQHVELSVKDEDAPLDELSSLVTDALHNKGLDGYTVKAVPPKEDSRQQREMTQEQKENMKKSKQLKSSLTKRLEEEGYELMFPVSVRINETEGIYINIIVAKAETRMDKLEALAKEEAGELDEKLKLDIRQVEKKAREQEKRWEETGVIGDIAGALVESGEYPVDGFSYSFHPYPLKIKVKTSLEKGTEEAAQIAEEIRTEVELYIQNAEETEAIRNDVYDLIIVDKNKEEVE